jgi:hypothetical protein
MRTRRRHRNMFCRFFVTPQSPLRRGRLGRTHPLFLKTNKEFP